MDLPDTINSKADAADVNLLCSEHVKVKFHSNGEVEELAGRWCLVCRYVSLFCEWDYRHTCNIGMIQRLSKRRAFVNVFNSEGLPVAVSTFAPTILCMPRGVRGWNSGTSLGSSTKDKEDT